MKILTIGNATSPHVLTRAKAFVKNGCENIILSEKKIADNKIEILSPFTDFYLKNVFVRPYFFLKNILIASWIITKKNYDLCNIYYANHYLAWIACIVTQKPIVTIAMGGDILFEQHKHMPWYQKALVKHTLYCSDLIIAKSPYLKERIEALLGKKSNVIVNIFGINKVFFKPFKKLKTRDWMFLSSRPLQKIYNIDKTIDIIYWLNKKGFSSNINILCYSVDSTYLSELKDKVHNLGLKNKVNFLPGADSPEQLVTLYSEANFVIALPDSDGIPQSALEGMAQGCINILSKNEVYKDIFDDNNSVLVSGDAKSIANIIIERKNKGSLLKIEENARLFVKERGNLKRNTMVLLKEFRILMTRKRTNNSLLNRLVMLLLLASLFLDQFLILGLRRKFQKCL